MYNMIKMLFSMIAGIQLSLLFIKIFGVTTMSWSAVFIPLYIVLFILFCFFCILMYLFYKLGTFEKQYEEHFGDYNS